MPYFTIFYGNCCKLSPRTFFTFGILSCQRASKQARKQSSMHAGKQASKASRQASEASRQAGRQKSKQASKQGTQAARQDKAGRTAEKSKRARKQSCLPCKKEKQQVNVQAYCWLCAMHFSARQLNHVRLDHCEPRSLFQPDHSNSTCGLCLLLPALYVLPAHV